MSKILDFLFSMRLMAIIVAIFAVSIAAATFIENDFGSDSARALVYNARWFELLLLLGMINLAGNILIQKLYRRQKFTLFLFHFSFLVILSGAAITRYTGFEGTMSLREGEETGSVMTHQTSITVTADPGDAAIKQHYPVFFSAIGRNKFRKTIHIQDKSFVIACKSFIPNAYPGIEAAGDGKPVAEIIYSGKEGRKSLVIGSGETKSMGSLLIAFDVPSPDSRALVLTSSGANLLFSAPFPVSKAGMSDQSMSLLEKGQSHRMEILQLYSVQEEILVLNKYFEKGKIVPQMLPAAQGETLDAVVLEVRRQGTSREIILWGKNGIEGNPVSLVLDSVFFTMNYGSSYKELPFHLKLNDFVVKRYPGSRSPSSFESHVTLTDNTRNISFSSRIFMNHILKYRGYRFYQSSYDPDENGSILSVNVDKVGIPVTYSGYLLMAIGMVLSLFSRKSHFRSLAAENARIKSSRNGLIIFLLIMIPLNDINAQEFFPIKSNAVVSKEHSRLFGRLLIQDNGGRIEPVNTLSSEVLRKLHRKNDYKGLNSDQVFLGMLSDPGSWQHEPIIRTSHPEVQKLLGSKGRYYSFYAFFNENHYILHDYVEKAFRKKPALRSKFDNEIIRLDERVNIAYLVFTGEMLRILPVPGDSSHTWNNHSGIQGKVHTADSVFTSSIIPYYLQSVRQSLETDNWKNPDEIVRGIVRYQYQFGKDVAPAENKVDFEILLNQSDIFSRISGFYGLIGFILLLLQFAGLFFTRLKLKIPITISIILIIILFTLHTIGLGMRWYISGHAPWSNGYEALTYIAWATVLAGLIFASRSSITLSTTSILAFLVLHTAHLSWMDPQITNLVPVLKSYWLVIHVATITASYGFLAMGALLAFINMLLMSLQSRHNKEYLHLTIREFSNITGMTLIIGLYLLTAGCFMGAVWANESWGRYWGWDPKETWALVTILLYAFITHMRLIPGLKGVYAFNLASLLGIGSVIMTYFGVNYYLSGLHSYAQGDPLRVPSFVYYSLGVVLLVAAAAYVNHRRLYRDQITLNS